MGAYAARVGGCLLFVQCVRLLAVLLLGLTAGKEHLVWAKRSRVAIRPLALCDRGALEGCCCFSSLIIMESSRQEEEVGMEGSTPSSPIRRRVSGKVSSPVPDMVAQGTSVSILSRLERSAEELSAGGSDIGDEIRRMHEEQKERERSRSSSRTSRTSIHNSTSSSSRTGRRSRTNSNSIVDVNTNARWGGYSPGGFIASPVGSVRSRRSWTHASLNSRAASASTNPSRFAAHMVEPLQEGRPLDSPLALSSSESLHSQEHHISPQPSQSSFARRYDQIAGDIQHTLSAIPPTPPPVDEQDAPPIQTQPPERPHSADTFQEAEIAFKDFDGVHYNPGTEEYVEFDHEGHEIRRVSARTSSGTLGDVASMMGMPRGQQRMSQAYAPPPGEGMVYYPAPVPRMLNLPKRLSRQLPAHIQAQRRSQMLSDMPRQNRESAPWIPPMAFADEEASATRSNRSGSGSAQPQQDPPRGMLNQRMSTGHFQNLPPQLRASMFFEQPSVAHNVEVKRESAVATLDAILASSATAPVTAFTDHPYVGDVRKSVYGPEKPSHNRKSTSTTLNQMTLDSPDQKLKKKRSSSIGNFFRRNSTTLEGETTRPASRGSMLDLNENGNKLRKRQSQMSLGTMSAGDGLERKARTPGEELADPMNRDSGLIDQATNAHTREDEDGQREPQSRPVTQILEDGDEVGEDEKERDEWEVEEPLYAQPTTLLAELQVRKAQLKSRNRTAATAYPNGMHSTLLQLDAVEAIEARKRQKKKIALAWEDPNLRAADEDSGELEDDVPLGVLFPSKSGLISRKVGDGRDWSRPLGLMEKREMEDAEPLAARRARLNPQSMPLTKSLNPSQIHLAGQPDMPPPEEDEHEDETLGQRLRRLKTKDALDTAISDVAPKDGERPESTLMNDVMSQFAGLGVNKEAGKSAAEDGNAVPEEEETLGQRRARLQREREASGEASTARPPLRTTQSMANLLSSNPVGSRQASGESQPAQGTLLHQSDQQKMRHKMDILSSNTRSSSYNPERPLVDSRPQAQAEIGGLLGHEASRPANGLFTGGRAHTKAMNTTATAAVRNRESTFAGLIGQQTSRPTNGLFTGGLQPAASQPMFGATPGYFASPTAGMNWAQQSMIGYPQQPYQQPMMNAGAYMALNGGHASMMPQTPGYNPMMGAGYGFGMTQQQGFPQAQMGYPNASMMNYGVGDPSLDPNQRAAIDRWRMGVA